MDQSIIENDQNRTYLPSSKANAERFEEGHVLYTGKLAVRHKRVGEIGVSFMTGKYNDEQEDGLTFDRSRWITAAAIDFSTKLPGIQTTITGEVAKIWVDVPSTYSQQFGSQQQGGFVDFVQPIIQRPIFHFSNAGHNPPFLINSDKKVTRLIKGGTVLGFMEDFQFEEDSIKLNSGDTIIIYSDGITEALNDKDEEVGEKRFLAVLKENLKSTAELLIEKVFEAVKIFAKDVKQSDDITIVVIKKI